MIRLDRILNLSPKEWRRVEYQPSAPRARIDNAGSERHQAAVPEWKSIYDEHQMGLFQKGVETGSIVRVKRRVPKSSGGGFEVVARLVHTRLIEPAWPAPVAEAPMPADLPPPARFFPRRKQTRPEVDLLETARSYLRLLRMGHDPEDIATSHNTTLDLVDRFLVLATANSDVHQLVSDGNVSVDVAIESVLKYGESAGTVLGLATKSSKQERRFTESVIPAVATAAMPTISMFGSVQAVRGNVRGIGLRRVVSHNS